MEQFIEKLIGRLEEAVIVYPSGYGCMSYGVRAVPISEVKKIVNQLAEEHLKDKDWETTRRFLDEKYFSKIIELSEKYNHPCEDIPINFVWVFGLIDKIEAKLTEEYEPIMNYNALLSDIKSQLNQFIADSNNIDYNRALVEAIEVIDKKSKEHKGGWIPCSKKYPKDNQTVLTIDSEGNMEVLDYDTNWENSFCKYGGTVKVFNIIAWQPLPKPYNTEGE